jgi:hypothetical protein
LPCFHQPATVRYLEPHESRIWFIYFFRSILIIPSHFFFQNWGLLNLACQSEGQTQIQVHIAIWIMKLCSLIDTSFSKEYIAFIIRVNLAKLERGGGNKRVSTPPPPPNCNQFFHSLTRFRPADGLYAPPKRWYLRTRLHGVSFVYL